MRYVLILLTLAAAVAFVASIALETGWVGHTSSGPATRTTASAPPARQTATPAAQPTPTASILAYYFADPTDVKVGPAGRVFVADSANNRVVELAAAGTQFPSWGSHAVLKAPLKKPVRVLPLRSGFYVIDQQNTRIARVSAGGALVSAWNVATLGYMAGPTGMALDPSGALYISDGNNDRILRLGPTGHVERSWSTKGYLASAQGGPNDPGFPSGVAVDAGGKVYVAYPNAGAVQKFSPEGSVIDKWQLPQHGAAASDVAVDRAGNVYVIDAGTGLVTKFAPGGALLGSWGGHAGRGRLINPTAITVDAGGHVYVSDNGDRKVGSFVREWTSGGKLLRTYLYG